VALLPLPLRIAQRALAAAASFARVIADIGLRRMDPFPEAVEPALPNNEDSRRSSELIC
jgi:hypothetical protein